jgi:hypothetical protein
LVPWACVAAVKLAKNDCSSGTYREVNWKKGSRLCSTGLKFSSSVVVLLSVLSTNGSPFFAALVSGPTEVRNVLKRGANGASAVVSGCSARSAGWNSLRKGAASTAKRSISLSATLERFSNVGSARKASANA